MGHDYGSMADVLGNSRPYKNLTDWLDGDPEFRREHRDVVDAVVKDRELRSLGTVNLMRSAGPISDAYIFAHDPLMLLNGPGGSGKTTASYKKILVEAQRMRPGPDRQRRYVAGVWRNKYVNLWKATIPSCWKVFPKDLPGSSWTGASPREAEHVINFEDRFGPIQFLMRFRAFNETMDADDVLGNEFTDVYLNEWNTLPEHLQIALMDRIGRDPPFEISGRPGRMFGDCNAPSVTEYVYRDFWEAVKPGHRLFRQPGGLHPDAENIQAVGRAYYENSARNNAHRPWWIKRMVHNQPGYTRANVPAWPEYDDDRNLARSTLEVIKDLPVIVGIDGGLTARAVFKQERGDGQLRLLAETSIEPAGMEVLGDRILAMQATPRFAGCAFVYSCDPAMLAGEDTEGQKSDRQRLAEKLGVRADEIRPAPTQNPDARREAIRSKLRFTCPGGEPGLLVDPSCRTLRRGANETFRYRKVLGSDDIGSIEKTLDGHTCEAAEYGALLCGTALARRRTQEIRQQREKRREETRKAKRYNPLRRRA
jgi:hypothetical protein